MKIRELSARHILVPLRKPIRHASHERTATDNVVVRCVLEDGTEGFGEGVPREYVTGETVDSALDLLTRSDLAGQLEPCADFAAAVRLAERLTLAGVPGDERGCQGNAARCALELAILDAYGKKFGQPLSAVVSLLAPELYDPRPRVRYSGAILSARGLKARVAAWTMWAYGFHAVKVKVGIDGYDDPARLRIIRSRVGSKMDLRVDANEAWSPAEVVERIRALEPFGISSVEQPVRHEDVACLRQVRQEIQTPVMLDESLCSRVDAEQALADQTCDLFNIRLSKCGGFIPSLRLAQLAKKHGLGYQLGCQVGETPILSAAGRHFACAVRDIRYLEGSYDRRLLRERYVRPDISFGWGGLAPALPGGGLGIDPDRLVLERATCRQVVLVPASGRRQ